GNVYIADENNARIRRVTPDGIINTYAGGGTAGLADGVPATSAQLGSPHAVAVDAQGNLYIADLGQERIRKVNTQGIISTVAGMVGPPSFSGDGGPATRATFHDPYAIAVDTQGNLYIADTGNNCIRRVTTDGIIRTIAGQGGPNNAGFAG